MLLLLLVVMKKKIPTRNKQITGNDDGRPEELGMNVSQIYK